MVDQSSNFLVSYMCTSHSIFLVTRISWFHTSAQVILFSQSLVFPGFIQVHKLFYFPSPLHFLVSYLCLYVYICCYISLNHIRVHVVLYPPVVIFLSVILECTVCSLFTLPEICNDVIQQCYVLVKPAMCSFVYTLVMFVAWCLQYVTMELLLISSSFMFQQRG